MPFKSSSGRQASLENLKKARLVKLARREQLLRKRHQKFQSKPRDEKEDTPIDKEPLPEPEQLIIRLRLKSLVKYLHNGLCDNLFKVAPSNNDKHTTLNIIKQIGLPANKIPLFWNPDEVYTFVRYVSPVKGIARSFREQEIDGEGLINLTTSDLTKYFQLDQDAASCLNATFHQLRKEIISRYINI